MNVDLAVQRGHVITDRLGEALLALPQRMLGFLTWFQVHEGWSMQSASPISIGWPATTTVFWRQETRAG